MSFQDDRDNVHHENRCPDCGRLFQLDYNKRNGRAQQTWQNGCGTSDACFKKYMPPSDFVPGVERVTARKEDL